MFRGAVFVIEFLNFWAHMRGSGPCYYDIFVLQSCNMWHQKLLLQCYVCSYVVWKKVDNWATCMLNALEQTDRPGPCHLSRVGTR